MQGSVKPLPSFASKESYTSSGVKLRSVTKRYDSLVAVENITLDIPSGSYCCLLGPSGCGKTTTLRMLAGHETVTEGKIYLGDRDVTNLPPTQRNTAMVFQNYALFPHQTVGDNVGFGLKMQGIAKSDRTQKIAEILTLVGMEAKRDRKPEQLSGGQQQRVALARGLVTRPQVLLLDEPLSALDESLRVKTRGELRKLQKQFGMTFIQVTHAQDEAFSLSDVIVVMNHGHVDQVGTPEEIYNHPASQFVAEFVGDNNIFQGRVINSTPHGELDRIQLDIPEVGAMIAEGYTVANGQEAACCVRSDRLSLEKADTAPSADQNSITARITAVEFTGYVIRVSLLLASGKELLYKTNIENWLSHSYEEGQTVRLSWSIKDCIFLSH
ncbi:UNVERIFIED_CONTAM: transporter [Euhalothece sp. KZN 001]